MPGSHSEADEESVEFRVEVADVNGLAEAQIAAAAWGEGPAWPQGAWRGFVETSAEEGLGWVTLLARGRGGELWGWLAASRVWERSELEYVLVGPAHRGQGVAGRLVEGWMAWAGAQGATEVGLEVRASNVGALRLYRGRGFAAVGRRRGYYREPTEDAVLMGRSL